MPRTKVQTEESLHRPRNVISQHKTPPPLGVDNLIGMDQSIKRRPMLSLPLSADATLPRNLFKNQQSFCYRSALSRAKRRVQKQYGDAEKHAMISGRHFLLWKIRRSNVAIATRGRIMVRAAMSMNFKRLRLQLRHENIESDSNPTPLRLRPKKRYSTVKGALRCNHFLISLLIASKRMIQ